MLDLRNRDPPGGCHDRIEIAGGLAVDEITFAIGFPCMDDREVGDETAFHNIVFPVELAGLLGFCDQCSDTGLREKSRYSRATSTDAFCEGSLRIELDLEFSLKVQVREELVLSDIGRDHLPNLPALQQQAQSRTIYP